jgi:hypothetical protein
MNLCVHNVNGYCKLFNRIESCSYCSEYREKNNEEETNDTRETQEDKD